MTVEPGAYLYRTHGHEEPYYDYVWDGKRGWYRWPERSRNQWYGYTPDNFSDQLEPHPEADRVWAAFVAEMVLL